MWRNGLYTMRAINACFGGKYPEKPLFEVGESKESSERQEHDGYTEQEIKEAREALVMQLQIMEGQQRRAKRYLIIKWRAAQCGLLSFLLP